MNNQSQPGFPSSSNLNPKNESRDYPSLSKLGLEASIGDVRYDAQGSKMQNFSIPKDVNYQLIGNSTNSMYNEKYDSNQSNNNNNNNIPPTQSIQNQPKFSNINSIDNNSKYDQSYNSDQAKNNYPPNMQYPQKMSQNSNMKNNNNSQNCSYHSNDINRGPPGYFPNTNAPNMNAPYGNPMPIPPVYPVPGIMGEYIPPPGEIEVIYQLRRPGFYPPPLYPPIDLEFYPPY